MVDFQQIKTPPPIIPGIGVSPDKPQEQEAGWEFRQGDTLFNFAQGRLLMNHQDLAQLVSENLSHLAASYWTTLARRLEEYRQWALGRATDPEQMALFAGMIATLLYKIEGRLKKKFDETTDGVAFHLEEGQLLLNGVNVHAFIQMAKRNPTQKAKVFLKGLKNRLGILLSNRFGNRNYEKIREVVERLCYEIDQELGRAPRSEGVILLPPRMPT